MTKVVIVDDEPGVLNPTAELLDLSGFDVVKVGDAEAIHETLRRERPDVLLQDVRMPGLDLPALMRTIRSDAPLSGLKVILYSAFFESEHFWRDIGADAAIEKPFRMKNLKELIDALAAR